MIKLRKSLRRKERIKERAKEMAKVNLHKISCGHYMFSPAFLLQVKVATMVVTITMVTRKVCSHHLVQPHVVLLDQICYAWL